MVGYHLKYNGAPTHGRYKFETVLYLVFDRGDDAQRLARKFLIPYRWVGKQASKQVGHVKLAR